MKLKIFSIGLLLALFNGTSGLPASEASPVNTASKTTKTINEKLLISSTITTTTTKVLPVATPSFTLNPTDLWYYGRDKYYHKIIYNHSSEICGLDENNIRSLESYRDCLDLYNLSSSISKEYITTTKVPTNNSSDSTNGVTCPPKSAWIGMYMNDAITDCNSKKAAVIHYGSCLENSPHYVCSASYTKHLDNMTFVETINPSFVLKKRDLSSDDSGESTSINNTASQGIKTSKTLPFSNSSSSETPSPTKNPFIQNYIMVISDGDYCCDCSSTIYKCCHTDQEQSVALVDNHGIWGIQLFDQKYEWCLYPETYPIYPNTIPITTTTTTTTTSSTCVPLTISTTVTERETVTKKNYVTVTVTVTK